MLEAVDQDARDPLFLGEDGAPDGLGGVGRKDRFNQRVVEEVAQAFDRETAGREALDNVLEAARLWDVRAQIGAPPADSVDALGHVDQRKVSGEGARNLGRLPGLETGQQIVQPAVRILVAVAPRPSGEACRLHGVKKRVTPLFAEHVAKQRTEKAHISP